MRHLWLTLLTLSIASLVLVVNYYIKVDPNDRLFDLDHVLDVQIEIPVDDWNSLRRQHPDLQAAFTAQDEPRAYTYFKAFVTIDGTRLGPVGVRKKGFIGSDSTQRPSLKIDFEEYVQGLELFGMKRLTLNNNQQDPSCMHQVLSYYLFRKAGVPAPRCNYAAVSVNGEYKGLYSNVEPIKKPFIRRHFADDEGNLYEGHRSDFRPGWTDSFERKTNDQEADRSDIDRVVQALELDDGKLIDAVAQVVDLEAFTRFWAMECLIGHWDGYSENLQNFYIYNDPVSGRFHFVPWGTDSTWGDPNTSLRFTPPASVRAIGHLSRRLYNHPDTRRRYREVLAELLKDVWNENELLDLVARLHAIVTTHQSPAPAYASTVEKVRQFIKYRRSILEAELRQPATTWDFPPESDPIVGPREPRGKVSATFSAKWSAAQGDLRQAFTGSTAEFELTWDEEIPQLTNVGAMASPFDGQFRYGSPQIVVGGITTKQGHLFGVSLIVDPELFAPGAELAIDSHSVMGDIIEIDVASPRPTLKLRGFLSGTLRLERASTVAGQHVSGTLTAEIR